ncbi:MAG TPA: M14 family zinc carboxypeptidase [Gemmatimonadaceae bacterium]|nr:M14 family zinc carboxypeptidase [Gemmatimonadaceae bacterium]
MYRRLAIAFWIACTPAVSSAQAPDTVFARLVREYTTDPHFLTPSTSWLPTSASIPSPQRHFGTIIGAPGVMHRTNEVHGYFRALAQATPRVRVERIGTTEEGREIIIAIIADEATMGQLDRYQALLRRLADPRSLPPSALDSVVRQAKPVYFLNGGLHSPEMGPPEMLMELAYRLAVSDSPSIRAIREKVITIINPVAEPDGRDKQVDWYYRYTKGRPDFDDGFDRSSPYWGKYVLHDNNRDGIQMSQELTKAVNRAYNEWHPIVMHDLHESVPLLYVSTGTGPYNETADPIAVSEWQLFANNDITAMSAEGLPGVWTWGFFDGWWPGYAIWVANNHNGIGRFYETFGNAGADTYVRDLSDDKFAGDPVTSRQWYRAWPPTKKVRWSSRDNTNYMETGVLASLTFTATNGERLLRNFYQKGANSIERGRAQSPHAFVIPAVARQRDPRRAAYLINQLERQGIEIRIRTSGDSSGDFVVLLDQPYRDLAVDLLSRQSYPSTAQYPPYDDIAWTLGLLYGVEVKPVSDTAVFHWQGLERVTDTVGATAGATGSGSIYLLRYQAQSELLPALHWLRSQAPKASAYAAEAAFMSGRDSFPVGSVVFEGLPASTASALASRFALPLVAAEQGPAVPRHALDLARVAIYHAWYDTQDEGWARFTFEQVGVPFTPIDKDDLKRGKLRQRFDVILIPNLRDRLVDFINGEDRKFSPIPFQKTKDTPALGSPMSSPDITGGAGYDGMAELQRFVDDGGTLITLGGASRVAGESGIASELTPYPTRALFHPGSIVRVTARSTMSPILYGYPASTTVFRGNGPLFQVEARDSALVVLQYGSRKPTPPDTGAMLGIAAPPKPAAPAKADTGGGSTKAAASADGESYVLSGMVRGQDEIIGQGAIFDIPVRKGRVIAFTFNPLHRFLNHHEFPMVWNAILNWNDRPAPPAAAHVVTSGK